MVTNKGIINTMRVRDYKYMIIGGTTKSATTSIFFYLKEHPQVCTANMKEVCFFLDQDYPIRSKYRFEDGLEKYAEFYSHSADSKLRVEATPDYLYSFGTSDKIFKSLPNVKMVFLLRDPISRLISWYKFAKQNHHIGSNISFDDYVKMQASDIKKSQHTMALEQGRYSVYLKPFFDIFGKEKVHVAFLEELSNNPQQVMFNICTFAGIDVEFYKNFKFEIYNRTMKMRSPSMHRMYKILRKNIKKRVHDKVLINKCLKRIRELLEPCYIKVNSLGGEKIEPSETTFAFLKKYYGNEKSSLEFLINRSIPWETYL